MSRMEFNFKKKQDIRDYDLSSVSEERNTQLHLGVYKYSCKERYVTVILTIWFLKHKLYVNTHTHTYTPLRLANLPCQWKILGAHLHLTKPHPLCVTGSF